MTSTENFTEIVPGEPSVGGFKRNVAVARFSSRRQCEVCNTLCISGFVDDVIF